MTSETSRSSNHQAGSNSKQGWFEPLSADVRLPESLYGGKASQLAELMRLGAQVPPGVALHSEYFERFSGSAGLSDDLRSLRDEPSLERMSDTAQRLVESASADAGFFQGLLEAVQSLPKPWIVRSSAIGEDGESSSFAGQLESIGGVESDADLIRAVKRCWASRWSHRVLSYERALQKELSGVGVVIQSEIKSKVAGVAFTRSPLSFDDLLVEYCDGPGERLVSGEVNPTRVAMPRDGQSFRVEDRGDIDRCLSDEEEGHLILGLQRECLSLEARRQEALDLEWVMANDGTLYFVQMRPITVLGPKTEPAANRPKIVWSNANMNENYPEPVTPLLASIATQAYRFYFEGLGRAFGIEETRIAMMQGPLKHLVGVHSGRLYYNLTNIYAILQAAPFHTHLIPYWNQFIGVEDGLVDESNDRVADAFGIEVRPHRTRETLRMILSTADWMRTLPSRVSRFEGRVEAFAQGCTRENLSQATTSALLIQFRHFCRIRFEEWTDAALADAASTISFGLLRKVLSSLEGVEDPGGVARELLEGGPPVESGQPVEELWELSRWVRDQPALHEAFHKETPENLRRLLERDDFLELSSRFTEYLETWGFRVSGELLLTKPSLDEDPLQALTLLKSFVSLEDRDAPALLLERRQKRAQERLDFLKAEQGSLLRRAVSPSWLLLERVLHSVHASIGLRERARLKQSLLYNRFRRLVLELGRRLKDGGSLSSHDDIFYLTYQEIDDLVGGHTSYPEAVRDLVRSRRDAHARAFQHEPPATVVLREGDLYDPRQHVQKSGSMTEGDHASGLTGVGACGGHVEGEARVFHSMAEAARFRKGDILVAKQTDPGWGPLFVLAGGLVLERGGLLSHGAIVAREFGIPAVVGVNKAFTGIADGDRIAVDGDRGTVEII